jgi:hypothetical protein
LRMAQVQFADGQTVTKRRISVGRHGLAHPTGERVFGLEEYAEAQIQGVMHETYEWVGQGHRLARSSADNVDRHVI